MNSSSPGWYTLNKQTPKSTHKHTLYRNNYSYLSVTRERKFRTPTGKGSINCRPCFHPRILNNRHWMLLWSAFCRGISGCKRPSSTASIGALSSSSLTPPNSNQLTFVLRYLLSARSFFPNTPTHPETRLRLHRTRRQEKRFEGGGEPRQSTGPGSLPGQLHHLPSPVFTSPPKPTLQRNSGRCGQIARRCGRLPPLRVRARPRRRRSPRAPRAVRPRNRSPRLGPLRGAGTRPGRGCGWPSGAPSGSPARLRRRRGLRHRGTVSAPQSALPPSRAHRGRRHCPRLPARPPASQPASHADLCSRGRRLRFARSSEAALAQPSSRRLSFSARRRRSGEGSAPDPPRPRRGRAPGGRGGAARRAHQLSALARPGSSGSPGSRRAPRTPDCCPPSPTAARTGVRGARAAAAAVAAARGRREEPQGSGRTGGSPRPLVHGVSGGARDAGRSSP